MRKAVSRRNTLMGTDHHRLGLVLRGEGLAVIQTGILAHSLYGFPGNGF